MIRAAARRTPIGRGLLKRETRFAHAEAASLRAQDKLAAHST